MHGRPPPEAVLEAPDLAPVALVEVVTDPPLDADVVGVDGVRPTRPEVPRHPADAVPVPRHGDVRGPPVGVGRPIPGLEPPPRV